MVFIVPSALTVHDPSDWFGSRSTKIGKGTSWSSFSAIDTVTGEPRPIRSIRSFSKGGSIRPTIMIGRCGAAVSGAVPALGAPGVAGLHPRISVAEQITTLANLNGAG